MKDSLPLVGRLPYKNNGQYIWKERQRWERIKTKRVSIRLTGYRDFYIEYLTKNYKK